MLQSIMSDIGIDVTTLAFMMAAAFSTAVFHAVSGFAGALLLVIILAPVVGIKTAVPIVAVAVIISSVTRLWVFRHDLDIPIFISLILTALPGMVIGALLFVYLPVDMIALLLGGFLAVSVPGRRLLKNKGVKIGRFGFFAIGPVYGVISGATMGAGLLLAPFFLGAGLSGPRIVAMTAALGVTLNITKTIVFGASPLLTLPLFAAGLVMGLCTIPGAYAGRWVLRKTPIRIHTLLTEMVILVGAFFFISRAIFT
ncbi:MAG: sulfite exporter TauE/SafE family protein [Rhodospirillales bacterium]|nr:sulfite exporter TauE/SafE family protein [Rhodospirillales bacterium]